MKIKLNKNIHHFRQLIVLISLTLTVALVKSDPFMTADGQIVTHIKHCLFHEHIYESHFSAETECSFNIGEPPSDEDLDQLGIQKRHIAHDPECFGEQNLPLNL